MLQVLEGCWAQKLMFSFSLYPTLWSILWNFYNVFNSTFISETNRKKFTLVPWVSLLLRHPPTRLQCWTSPEVFSGNNTYFIAQEQLLTLWKLVYRDWLAPHVWLYRSVHTTTVCMCKKHITGDVDCVDSSAGKLLSHTNSEFTVLTSRNTQSVEYLLLT